MMNAGDGYRRKYLQRPTNQLLNTKTSLPKPKTTRYEQKMVLNQEPIFQIQQDPSLSILESCKELISEKSEFESVVINSLEQQEEDWFLQRYFY